MKPFLWLDESPDAGSCFRKKKLLRLSAAALVSLAGQKFFAGYIYRFTPITKNNKRNRVSLFYLIQTACMKKTIVLLLFLLPFWQGCNLRQQEEALDQREATLNQREQELLLKEKSLELREIELAKQQQHIDSTKVQDSTAVYNASLPGIWDVKMTCTETSCPGSAVGDTRNESWEISYQENNVIARAMMNNELVRVYSGFFTGNTLELVEARENAATQPPTRIVVRLRLAKENVMEGQREIERVGECKIIYAITMNKKVVQP